jgi:flagellar hook-associated protein 2
MSAVTFSGLASGIDSTSIIASILDQRRATQIKPLQTKISTLTDTNSSLAKLSDLLDTLKGTADKFRDINGTVLAKTAASSSETRVTATAANTAGNGAYAVNVLSLAKNGNSSFDDRYSSTSQTINSSINNGAAPANRTVTVQVGTGADQESVAVELTNTTTAADFVSQFNTSSTKAEASLVNVGTASSPSYAIVINSNNQGTNLGELSTSVGSEITSAGSGAFVATTTSQATNAQFTVSGISGTFTRANNTVSDVITGVTLSLQSTGAATITIGDDASTTATTVQSFVDAYNDVVKYIAENDLVSTDETGQNAVFGPLASTSIDEGFLGSLRSSLSSSSISSGLVSTLGDLGIKTERDGTLRFDSTKFKESVASDPESVRSITRKLGDSLASVGGIIAQYTQFNGLIDVAERSNQSSIDSYNKRVSELEKALSQQEFALKGQYARLESIIGKLNSQQSALAGLGG